ncbi:MAG: ABC transporter permease [Virgibacillus proomii]|jgi:ABC-2 type transport system permease protein
MKIWHIAAKDLHIFLRDIPGLAYLIMTPIIVIAIASFALSGMFTEGEVEQFSVPIVVNDVGEATNGLLDVLQDTQALKLVKTYKNSKGEKQPMTIKKAKRMLTETKAAIVIPEGSSKKVEEGDYAEVTVIADPVDKVIPGVVTDVVSQYTSKLSMGQVSNKVAITVLQSSVFKIEQMHGVKVDPSEEINFIKEKSEEYVNNPPITVNVENAELDKGVRKATPFESNVPGYAVMFVLLGTATAATSLLDERDRGTLRKLQSLPISRLSILSGKMLSNFLTALFQMFVLFTVGHFAFGMWLGNSILGLIILIVATAFAATGLAMIIASLCKTRAQANGVSLLIVLSMSVLGGSWWPLYIVPEWLQKVAHVTLTAWPMGGFNNLLIYGEGLNSILLPVTVLFSMGVVFLLLSVRLFRFN